MSARVFNVGITSRRYEEAVAFYRDVLGFGVHASSDVWCFLDAGGVYVVVVPHASATEDPRAEVSGPGIWLDVIVEDLDEQRRRLEEAKVAVEQEWEDHNGRHLLVRDPDGNWLDLFRPG